MRTTETILGIIGDRGRRDLPLGNLYRQLYNQDLYLSAYGRISSKIGSLTTGMTPETVDGMSQGKIQTIIEQLRHDRFRWTPVRRKSVPKKNGKTRPLGIPTWTDKLVQEVIRSLLSSYYEPRFSELSHGFRPARGCHTALDALHFWNGTKWFIEGDIRSCFDKIDHQIMMSILRERVTDSRLLILIEELLKSGYMEEWVYHRTYSGTPQGGVLSPLLANIYLDKLDKFVEQILIPEYTLGESRRNNKEYYRHYFKARRCRAKGDIEGVEKAEREYAKLPSTDQYDPGYRRLRYIRYADDFLLGFAGPKEEAEVIKERIREFLRESLHLELSEEKTLITHANQKARFLGYDVTITRSDSRKSINGQVDLRIPEDVLNTLCSRYAKNGKPIHRPERIGSSDFDIVSQYGVEFRGILQYYKRSSNIAWLHRLRWYMGTSLMKTLANKHKSTVTKMARRFKVARAESGLHRCYEVTVQRGQKSPVTARFGGEPLCQDWRSFIDDSPPKSIWISGHTELVQRLLAEKCECCGSTKNVCVHHIRKLKDLNKTGRVRLPSWKLLMIRNRRKTLVLCEGCHQDLHAGRPLNWSIRQTITGEPDEAKVSSPVRRGDDEKVPF